MIYERAFVKPLPLLLVFQELENSHGFSDYREHNDEANENELNISHVEYSDFKDSIISFLISADFVGSLYVEYPYEMIPTLQRFYKFAMEYGLEIDFLEIVEDNEKVTA